MLQINQSKQHDGLTFSLSPKSQVELKRRNPDVNPLPRIFIAFEDFSDFQSQRGDLYEQVAQLLTRLSEAQLTELGGFKIVDPVTNKRLDRPDA